MKKILVFFLLFNFTFDFAQIIISRFKQDKKFDKLSIVLHFYVSLLERNKKLLNLINLNSSNNFITNNRKCSILKTISAIKEKKLIMNFILQRNQNKLCNIALNSKSKDTICNLIPYNTIKEEKNLESFLNQKIKIKDTLSIKEFKKFNLEKILFIKNYEIINHTKKNIMRILNFCTKKYFILKQYQKINKIVNNQKIYYEFQKKLSKDKLKSPDISKNKFIINNENFSGIKKKLMDSIKKESINLVLFLHFKEDTNNSLNRVSKDLFIGAKIAIDSITRNGQKVNLRLVDCGNNQVFNDFLKKYDFSTVNLVIGPLKKDHILKVSNRLINHNIPIISPLSNSLEYISKTNIVASEPLDFFIEEKILNEIYKIDNIKNIYLIYGDHQEIYNAKKLGDKIHKVKKNISIQVTNNLQLINFDIKDQYVVIVLMSQDDRTINSFLKYISTLDKKNIKLFSKYYHPNFESNIYKPFLKKNHLIYFVERNINLNIIEVKKTLMKFQEYCIEPSKYSIIGFDVTYDSIQRILYNNEYFNISSISTRLATKFDYIQKKSSGAYYNRGFQIIRMSNK